MVAFSITALLLDRAAPITIPFWTRAETPYIRGTKHALTLDHISQGLVMHKALMHICHDLVRHLRNPHTSFISFKLDPLAVDRATIVRERFGALGQTREFRPIRSFSLEALCSRTHNHNLIISSWIKTQSYRAYCQCGAILRQTYCASQNW